MFYYQMHDLAPTLADPKARVYEIFSSTFVLNTSEDT